MSWDREKAGVVSQVRCRVRQGEGRGGVTEAEVERARARAREGRLTISKGVKLFGVRRIIMFEVVRSP